MAMPQRDDPPTPRLRRTGTIEAIKRLDALLEYAVMQFNETERIREEWTGGCVGFVEGRGATALPA